MTRHNLGGNLLEGYTRLHSPTNRVHLHNGNDGLVPVVLSSARYLVLIREFLRSKRFIDQTDQIQPIEVPTVPFCSTLCLYPLTTPPPYSLCTSTHPSPLLSDEPTQRTFCTIYFKLHQRSSPSRHQPFPLYPSIQSAITNPPNVSATRP